MRLTYNTIVKNLDATIDHLTKKMISMYSRENVVASEVSAYSELQDQIAYYKMLRKACAKRISAEPIVEKIEELIEVRAENEVVSEELYVSERIFCANCKMPLLEEHTNCPICGKKINWDTILYNKDGIKVAYNDNGSLTELRKPHMESVCFMGIDLSQCKDGVGQLNIFDEEGN